jgi:diaminohydroxyphosphoribosylaminopyrimidine deaminase/5-amino-6-(5-phosphoribosylamino)uracil reductase
MDEFDLWHMRRALEMAARGQGYVEPNPMVGCVLVGPNGVVGEGWHKQFGGDHAEIEALRVAGPRSRGATAYVTLEPCCHTGKTPPCTTALIAAGVSRVVAAMQDSFSAVNGRGLAELAAAGIEIEVGLLEKEARGLNAPYLKRLAVKRPWLIAKWAMTLDGKIATRTSESRWITGPAARQIGHQLRGRVDGILVGRGTASADDPMLMARPPGARRAARIVADTRATLASESKLVRTAYDAPVLVAAGSESSPADRQRLTDAGCYVFICDGATPAARLEALFDELGRREMTNILVEGGSRLLGSLWDADAIDELHVFIAAKLIGGSQSPSPIGGQGLSRMADVLPLIEPTTQFAGDDFYIHARVAHRMGDANLAPRMSSPYPS